MKHAAIFIIFIFIVAVRSDFSLAQTNGRALISAAADESCDDSTASEIACHQGVANRARIQLAKDWMYVSNLARSRNQVSVKFLTMGHQSFQDYLEKNCESEGHDALGASLQEVLEQKCRRDTILWRRKLFERMGEAHPMGRDAEALFGRPICSYLGSESNPLTVGATVNLKNVDDLRRELDQIGVRAARRGEYAAEIATLLRAMHVEAERLRGLDATYTCLGILKGFCSNLDKANDDFEIKNRDEWLSRCQTHVRSGFYKRATMRLRNLKSE